MEEKTRLKLSEIILSLRGAASLLNGLSCQYSSDGTLTDEENELAHNAVYDLFCKSINDLDALVG